MDKWLEGAPLKVVEAGATLIPSAQILLTIGTAALPIRTIPVENKAPSR